MEEEEEKTRNGEDKEEAVEGLDLEVGEMEGSKGGIDLMPSLPNIKERGQTWNKLEGHNEGAGGGDRPAEVVCSCFLKLLEQTIISSP